MDPRPSSMQAGRLAELWALLRATVDVDIRNQIIEHYLPWCRDVARALYLRRGGLPAEFGEYLQMATLAMIDCVNQFDPALGVPFEAYALPRVRGRVLDELHLLSEKHEQVFLQSRMRRQQQRAAALRDTLAERPAGENPPDAFEQLAQLTIGLAVAYMLEGTGLFRDERSEQTGNAPYASLELTEQREWLRALVLQLPDQERRVMRYHYFHGLTLADAAQVLGLTKGRISQIHGSALSRLREMAVAGRIDRRL